MDQQSEIPERAPLIRRSSSGSVSLNQLNTSAEEDEAEAISLLRQIFPELATGQLRALHRQRLGRNRHKDPQHVTRTDSVTPTTDTAGAQRARLAPKSKLGQRLVNQLMISESPGSHPRWPKDTILPHDFLRLPPNVAVRRIDEDTGQWHYQLVDDLASQATRQHIHCREVTKDGNSPLERQFYTRALFRDPTVGLGVTLYEHNSNVLVYSLTSRDGTVWNRSPDTSESAGGPAILAGIAPGDALIGINGTALLEGAALPEETMLQYAVKSIRKSDDPIVLHFERYAWASNSYSSVTETLEQISITGFDSTCSTTAHETRSNAYEVPFHSTPVSWPSRQALIHPFVGVLRAKNFLESYEAERNNTIMLYQYMERTQQWEASSFMEAYEEGTRSMVTVPLAGIRKALCVRIMNSFLDGDEAAYTIWVYDVETGSEWYAPVRYLRDFDDLRSALLDVLDSISNISFPKQSFSIFGSPSRKATTAASETTCRQLESFLRTLCSMIYRETLHPGVAEVAIYIQSFLGCEQALINNTIVGLLDVVSIRLALKRSIQQYAYRLFLLDGVQRVVTNFIDMTRARGPRLEDLEFFEAQGRSVLKTRAMESLEETRKFLDLLQSIVFEGCMDDFRSIADREEYQLLCGQFAGKDGAVVWETLVREAVREQIEIEVYVPVRGVISRWLVHGWRHDDIEVQFKVNELRKRPQGRFQITEPMSSSTSWSSVSTILKKGVGQSTLPCNKLRAIVDAAREITSLVTTSEYDDRRMIQSGHQRTGSSNLGADSFLPIFIYCVVMAELDRPCALKTLLKSLCDPINRIGEVGYFLACFEAAVSHIQELDLSVNDQEETLSLLSIPLDESY